MPTVYEPRPRPRSWNQHRMQIRGRWSVPFHGFEWLTQWTAYFLSRWSFLEVLEYAGRFTVLVAVVIYFMEAPDRRKQKHYQAWQVINSAQGQSGGGGRREALEELHHDHVPLVALDVRGAYLQGLTLPRADLHRSNMNAADLRDCDLHGSNLEASELGANFRKGNLRGANLSHANLTDADLTEAVLAGADLTGATLSGVDFHDADLTDVRWQQIAAIDGANLDNVRNPPAGFLSWARGQGAQKKK